MGVAYLDSEFVELLAQIQPRGHRGEYVARVKGAARAIEEELLLVEVVCADAWVGVYHT